MITKKEAKEIALQILSEYAVEVSWKMKQSYEDLDERTSAMEEITDRVKLRFDELVEPCDRPE
jgi:hypothetical protein